MECTQREETVVDVICQHTAGGDVIPLKIRIQDEDGAFQVYRVRSYRDVTDMSRPGKEGEILARNHMWCFECKISVFRRERRIKLRYNAYENLWWLLDI